MGDVFDRWLTHSLEVRLKTALLKPSTAKSYRSMVETHLPGLRRLPVRRLSSETVGDWLRARADEIAAGTLVAQDSTTTSSNLAPT
jgi:hypothetical protein